MSGRAGAADDPVAAFIEAMRAAGLEPVGAIRADGRLHRVTWHGDRKGSENGWYVLHVDGYPAGAFGCWKRGIRETWAARGEPLDEATRRRLAQQVERERKRRQKELREAQERAAKRAAAEWESARPAPSEHAYLRRKGIRPHLARVDGRGRLVLPMRDADGKLWGLQRIPAAPKARKLFSTGARVDGCFALLGELAERVVICEGFATGASVHEATGLPVLVAFAANNLERTARSVRQVRPEAEIVVAADDDRDTKGNPGRRYAGAAAEAVGGRVAVPEFREPEGRTDFNDLALAEGLAEVARQIGAAGEAAILGEPEPAGATAGPEVAASGEPRPKSERQRQFLLVREREAGRHPGVYVEIDDKASGERSWRWLCSPIEVAADTRDAVGEQWGRLLLVTDPDGVQHAWAMPMAMLAGDGTAYRERLLSLGLRLAPGLTGKNSLHELISTWRPREKVRCTDRIGWHGDGDCFVLPDRTYGAGSGERVLLQTPGTPPAYSLAGSLDGWRCGLAGLAHGNSRLVFAISTAFAGPALHLLGEESGGFHLAGWSSSGKTTALHCASTVWGVPVHSWRTTDNAAESLARGASDTLLCLDEIGAADVRAVDALAYMLAAGAGKARMRRDTTTRPIAAWRILFLSSGEVGLAARLAEVGRRARSGQSVRAVEIPADAGRGYRLFEALNGEASADALARSLRAEASAHHGHPGRTFLERITADLPRAVAELAERRRAWLRDHLPEGADGQVGRVAGRFALVAAAGELATRFLITPWREGDAAAAAAVCFKAWLGARGGIGPADIRDGLAQVRAFLEQHGSARFEAAWRAEDKGIVSHTMNRAGFRQQVPEGTGEWNFYVLPESWRQEVCRLFDSTALAREMSARGWFGPGDGKNLTRTLRVPGHGKLRVYHVLPEFLAGGAEDEPEQGVDGSQGETRARHDHG